MMWTEIIAVDFDGTLCENKWPEIGEANHSLIRFLNLMKEHGDKLILYTMREGEKLQQAVDWCGSHGLTFDAINDNLPEMKAFYGSNPRKVFANYYIDDHNAPDGWMDMLERREEVGGLYNELFGYNPACVFVLPMLGRKMDEYPRFRDCFIDCEGRKEIIVYTRVGGGNRGEGYGEEKLYKDPNYLRTYDDDFDSTYGSYVFKVPEEWEEDFDLIEARKFNETSDAYVQLIVDAYPSMKDALMKFLRPDEEDISQSDEEEADGEG